MYIDKLEDIVNKYNNTCHRTIKMKLVDVKPSIYINCSKEINDKDPKFEIGDIVRISKYQNIFAKSYVPNWFAEVKNTVLLLVVNTVISDPNGEEVAGTFKKKNICKKKK